MKMTYEITGKLIPLLLLFGSLLATGCSKDDEGYTGHSRQTE